MIDLGLGGRRAIVSGAGFQPEGAGHGRAVSLRLAEAGATVACIDIDTDRAEGTARAIEATGGRAFAITADMTDARQVDRALDEAVERLSGLDVCVDIIGRATWNRVEDFTDEDWAWTIENNLTQVFYLYRSASRRMIEQGTGGALVGISSVDGIAAAAYHSAYGAAKAGVISLTKTFADELGSHGIRVNAVAPGNVGTSSSERPDGKYGYDPCNPLAPPRPTDIANAVLFLASSLSDRITGQTLVVDGGATVRSLWGMTPDHIAEFRVHY
jgi:3-oxoacyl-[acyl-carrier protein] reductase